MRVIVDLAWLWWWQLDLGMRSRSGQKTRLGWGKKPGILYLVLCAKV